MLKEELDGSISRTYNERPAVVAFAGDEVDAKPKHPFEQEQAPPRKKDKKPKKEHAGALKGTRSA